VKEEEDVAFWLLPAEPERNIFKDLIGRLALRFDAPDFEPHVTLHGGRMTVPRAREILGEIAAAPTLQLQIEGLAFSESYTKTVFVQFRASAETKALSAAVAADPEASSGYQFDPHISLIYKEMPAAEKEVLAKTIEIPFRNVTFDSIRLIACPAKITRREHVESWRILAERPLAEKSR
jgi:2'-5' RNA ligase